MRSQQPPPSPAIDLEQVMNNQTFLLEALANAITRPRSRGQGMNDKLTDFLWTKASFVRFQPGAHPRQQQHHQQHPVDETTPVVIWTSPR